MVVKGGIGEPRIWESLLGEALRDGVAETRLLHQQVRNDTQTLVEKPTTCHSGSDFEQPMDPYSRLS